MQGGILLKINDIELFLENSNIAIVCFNEHWLHESQLFLLDKMRLYKVAAFYCRKVGSKGGGSSILLKLNLNDLFKGTTYMFLIKTVFLNSLV